MASSSNAQVLTEIQKSTKYHKTVSLNLDCGSETLRKLIEKKLLDHGTNIKQFLKDIAVQNIISRLKRKKILYQDQLKLLNANQPNLDFMDVTLLTLLLLKLLPNITINEEKKIEALRKKRNDLAHNPNAQLTDDVPFNEAEKIIKDLSQSVGSEFEKKIGEQIELLRRTELVRVHTKLEMIHLRGEQFAGELIEGDVNGQYKEIPEFWIKFGLTKWVRYMSRSLKIDVLLQELKTEGVISDTVKRTIENCYNYEEQMQSLALHMMDETKENLLRFCSSVRKLDEHIADILEDKMTDGLEIEERIKTHEHTRIKEILTASLFGNKGESISCEEIHIFVESRQKRFTDFSVIAQCVKEVFGNDTYREGEDKFVDIGWKNKEMMPEYVQEVTEESLTDMSCDIFAKILGEKMEKIRVGIGKHFEEKVLEESLSSNVFANLPPEILEEIFSQGLCVKYGIGIKNCLLELQKDIKRQINRAPLENSDTLRKIDQTADTVSYTKSTVTPSQGNLLVAAHEFVYPVRKGEFSTAFMAKEVIRFAAACINGKKNGTIHFGIQDIGHKSGRIVGLDKKIFGNRAALDEEITQSMKVCFRKDYDVASRCVRPVQVVSVEDDHVVLEVDIVPCACYTKETLITVYYPPKGNCRENCYIYINNIIVAVELQKMEYVTENSRAFFKDRTQLESQLFSPVDKSVEKNQEKLRKLLTGGNKYVTDAFVPVICCGDASGSPLEDNIRHQVSDMSIAFKSSFAVFDFDYSVKLRERVENDSRFFLVRTAEDFSTKRIRHESDLSGETKMWIYTNGNEEIDDGKLNSQKWYATRLPGVKNAFDQIRKQIPKDRGLLIFLVFQKTIGRDPMLETARDCFLHTFKGESVIIAQDNETLQDWRMELSKLIDKDLLEKYIVSGLSWGSVSSTIRSLFKPSKEIEYSLPDSDGNIVILTKSDMEELNFKHIEVIDGEAEKHLEVQEENMPDEECKERRLVEETEFYRGNQVTWWNFYYDNQVLKREAYELHRDQIKKKLISPEGEDLFETHLIEHHPGAGGSTLGRHMLWHFSQIKQSPKLAYRCCIIHHITDNTVDEIYKLQTFKGGEARPVIGLVDNASEEHIQLLKHELQKVAYQKGCPAKLFCLLLIVRRVPVSSSSREIVLKHSLTKREKGMFETKFKELEKRDGDVRTLLAFNVMRNSFEKKFIDDTSKSLLAYVTPSEMELFKCLSLINTYDTDNPVPESIFDSLMRDEGFDSNSQPLTLKQCVGRGPFGLVYPQKYKKATDYVARETWNVHISEEMQLMIKRTTTSEKYHFTGVNILSQPLAESILKYIMDKFRLTLEDIVHYLLSVVGDHRDEVNPMSKLFVRVVCGLFTVRQVQENEKGEKEKFSDLILELEKTLPDETAEMAYKRVVGILEKCFIVTGNAFVGQQLARYNIYIKKFEDAKAVIQRSLEIKPHHSYLLDTYGQIFRAEMELLLSANSQEKIADGIAAQIVGLAVNAIERFKMAQKANESEEDKNVTCFQMEVKTTLLLLENFHKFECYDDLEGFWLFLNDTTFDIATSSFKTIVELEPHLKQFQNGNEFQQHVEMSLRTMEEREYMLKNQLSAVVMPSKDVLMLKPRQAFERFYGSKEHTLQFEFHYGVGLKLLMRAFEAKENLLRRRMEDAEKRLDMSDNREMERDLLVYLGYYVIVISKRQCECDLHLYRKLVSYSTKLWKLQQDKKAEYRRYVEAYMYYAMFHWLLPSREETGLDILSHPETMKECLKQWEQVYLDNFGVKSHEQLYKNTPKIYFALGQGSPGNDIIDVEWIRQQWRRAKKKEGRNRKEVKADKHWQHPVVEKEVLRLSGTVDSSGRKVNHKVTYRGKQYNFQISTNENCIQLGNRPVTFIIGFSWMAPTALDVRLDVQRQLSSRPSSGNSRNPGSDLIDLVVKVEDTPKQETVQKQLSSPSSGNSGISDSYVEDLAAETTKHETVSEKTDEDKLMESENIADTMFERQGASKPVNKTGFIIVQDAKQSAEIAKHLIENPPSYIVVVDICRNVAGGRKNLCLLMLHVAEVDGNETYVYQLSDSKPSLMADRELHKVLKTCKTVWFDIQSASMCLIEDYDVIIDNIADIQVMLRYVSEDAEELKTLELEQLDSWSSRCIYYGKLLLSGQLSEECLLELARHAELIGRVYAICQRHIDQSVRCTALRRAIGKETFEAAQPDKVKEKIQRLKKQEKKQRQKKSKKDLQKENEAQQ